MSCTVTVNAPVAMCPAPSDAMHVTGVVPSGNNVGSSAGEAGAHSIDTTPTASDADGA